MDGVKVSNIKLSLNISSLFINAKVWSVEDDMQLAEVISRVAEREVINLMLLKYDFNPVI